VSKARLVFFDLELFSVNSTYRHSKFGVSKTSGANEWCSKFFYKLAWAPNQAELDKIRNVFNEKLHGLEINIIAVLPKEDLFTKKGTLSSRSLDVTNYEKIICDCLCLPKFNDEPLPKGAPNLNIDDKSVVKVQSQKAVANGKRGLIVEVSLVPLDSLLQINIENN
jgi:hypothetical protein